MTASRYVDLHVLHPTTAANLNSSHSGEPKTIEYGGAVRTMVSSYAWNRRVREEMEDALDEHAARTRMVPPVLADTLRDAGWPEDLADFAAEQVAASAKKDGLKTNPDRGHRTQAMLYLPADAPGRLAALCADHRDRLEEALAQRKTGKKQAPSVLPTDAIVTELTRRTATINLFGRMLAEIPDGHVDSALQNAPAFTVHQADPEPDFFTSKEDWPRPGEGGSAHLETAYRTAGHYYRYATINVTALTANLQGDEKTAHTLIDLFAWHFIMTMPCGGQTSSAAHTVPDLVHYVVRDRRPVSYGAAFEQPLRSRRGYTAPARETLAAYATAIDRLVGTRHRIAHGHATVTPATDTATAAFGTCHTSFDDLTAALADAALTPHTQDTAA